MFSVKKVVSTTIFIPMLTGKVHTHMSDLKVIHYIRSRTFNRASCGDKPDKHRAIVLYKEFHPLTIGNLYAIDIKLYDLGMAGIAYKFDVCSDFYKLANHLIFCKFRVLQHSHLYNI